MDHDYKAAKQWLDENVIRNKDNVRIDLILDHALEIARKLQEGFVMVPVEPTEKQLYEAVNAAFPKMFVDPCVKNIKTAAGHFYVAMITAAQETRKG